MVAGKHPETQAWQPAEVGGGHEAAAGGAAQQAPRAGVVGVGELDEDAGGVTVGGIEHPVDGTVQVRRGIAPKGGAGAEAGEAGEGLLRPEAAGTMEIGEDARFKSNAPATDLEKFPRLLLPSSQAAGSVGELRGIAPAEGDGRVDHGARRNTTDALVPPNPKLFESAYSIGRSCAVSATRSITLSRDGFSRLSVGGAT